MDWNSSSSKNNNPPFLSHHHHHHHPSSQFSSNNFHHNFNHFGPFPGFLEAKYHEGTPVEMMGTPNIIPPNIEMMRDHMISMSYGVNNQDKMKKRLTAKQLDSLESSFQEERKLDPDRKMKLARDLGLQPRQIAVWFQNRRARWKSKKLEHLYDALKHDFDVVSKEKQKLQDEVQRLKCMLMEQATTRKQMHSGYTEASCEETVESTSVADLNNANNDEEDNNNNDDDNNNNNNRAAAAAAAGVIFSRDQNKVGGHYHHLFNNVDVYNAISPSYWGALA